MVLKFCQADSDKVSIAQKQHKHGCGLSVDVSGGEGAEIGCSNIDGTRRGFGRKEGKGRVLWASKYRHTIHPAMKAD